MKISQKYLELFLSELKSYRRLTVAEVNYYAQNPDVLIQELRDIRERVKQEKEEAQRKAEEERLAELARLEAKFDAVEREREEKARAEEDEHIAEVTCMDLPTDFENLYSLDEEASSTHVESVNDALIYSLNRFARVDIEYISQITGLDLKTVIMSLKGAIFQNPETWDECFYKGWETSDQYLSGSLREKLRVASEANLKYKGYFADNIKAIEAIMPKSLSSKEIYVTLGSPWLPTHVVDDFIVYLLGNVSRYFAPDKTAILHDEDTGTWEIPLKSRYRYTRYRDKCEDTYGTNDANALHIIEKTLNQSNLAVYDEKLDPKNPKKKIRVLNQNKTLRLLEKQDAIIKAFRSWVWRDEARRLELERIYDMKYSSTKVRHFDGSFLKLPNMNPDIELYPYQRNAVARILFTPNTLLAHDVGSGKTYIMIAAGMELRRMGISRKNIYVVPNNLVGQWRDIFLSMYPNAKLLTVEPKSFGPTKRFSVLKKIRDEEFDGIIMAYSSFELIPTSKEFKIKYLEQELEAYNNSASKLSSDRFAAKKRSIEKKIKTLQESAEVTLGKVFFEELEINTVFLDEAHNYKNVPIATHVERVNGISASGSAKCQDMLQKLSFVQRTNGGRGVVLATGTPITNSITDAFVMQKYLQNGDLKLLGLASFDGWIGMFAEMHTEFEVDVDTSSYKLTSRFSRFHNLPELTSLFASVADFHMVDKSAGIPDFGGYHDSITSPNQQFEEYLKVISERADQVRHGKISRKEDNLLLITTDGRKAALDMRLIDDTVTVPPGSKVDKCAENIFNIYRCTHANKSAQLVFCDYSTPKDGFNIYDELKDTLVTLGIPPHEIAFIHSATTPKLRESMFEAVRNGDIRVLIGSTFKLGLGVNVQDRLIAVHHLDVPWRPADMTQREGRILRQGNTNERVFIFRYITKSSFDAYSWQLLETKQRFISSILSGHLLERDGSDISDTVLSYAEVKAIAIGNPLVKERVEVANKLDKLIILKRESVKRLEALSQERLTLPPMIEAQRAIVDKAYSDKSAIEPANDEMSKEEKNTFREQLEYAIRSNVLLTKETELMEYRGFKIVLPSGMSADKPFIWLEREGKYHVDFGESSKGYQTRIDNFLDGFDKHIDKLEGGLNELTARLEHIDISLSEPDDYSEKIEKLQRKLKALDKKLGVA